jgi:membrane dipeptidase
MKKILISFGLTVSVALFSFVVLKNDDAETKKIHKKILTIDSHIDIRADFNAPSNNAGKETLDQIDLPKLERGDLDIATIALFADPDKPSPENNELARKKVADKYIAIQRWVEAHPEKLEFVKSTSDIDRVAKNGKHGILLSFLNAFWFKDLSTIDEFYKDGVRVFGFNHAGNTDFAGSSRPVEAYGDKADVGLSELGEKAITKINQLGIVLDVSQLSTPALLKAVELSKAPVIASHSGLKNRVDVTRNLNEAELKTIAAKGGVIQIVAFAGYLKKDPAFTQAYLDAVAKPFGLTPLKDDPKVKLSIQDYKKYQAAYLEFSRNEWRFATLSDYIDAVDAAVKIVGIDHVGLSSDFNHGGGVVGFASVADAPNVTAELLKRKYSEQDIAKLWGGNFLRVFKKVQTLAANN